MSAMWSSFGDAHRGSEKIVKTAPRKPVSSTAFLHSLWRPERNSFWGSHSEVSIWHVLYAVGGGAGGGNILFTVDVLPKKR